MSYRSIYLPLLLSEAFPNERTYDRLSMLQFRLQQFNREQALHLCAQLNYYVSRHEKPLMSLQEQVPLLKWLLPENKINQLLRRASVPQVRNVYKAEPTVFTRHQLLELVRYIFQFCSDSALNPLQNNKSKKAFLISALLVNDILMDSFYGHLRNELDSSEMRKAMLEPIRQSAKLATPAPDFVQQFFRGASLFLEYMPDVLPEFEKVFREYTGVTLREYYGCLFIVAGHYTFLAQSQNQIISKQLYCQDENICRMMALYLELESYSITEFIEAFENQANSHPLKPLRERPILRLNEEAAIVLDPAFHTDKASIGPLFAVPGRIGQSMDAFGFAFERYVQDILHWICVNSGISSDNLKKNQILGIPPHQLGEIDAAILDSPSLILFEIKGKWIKDNPRIEPEYDTYLDDLHDKYGEGARQLAQAINYLINNPLQAQIEGHEIAETPKIFPVLVVYDSSLVLPGYTQYFESEFANEMEACGNFQKENKVFTKDQWLIAPLTVMTVDALEWLEESVANFQLAQLLENYTYHRNQSPYETEDTSLVEYIKWSRYKNFMQGSERIRQKVSTLFQETLRNFLPDELANRILTADKGLEEYIGKQLL